MRKKEKSLSALTFLDMRIIIFNVSIIALEKRSVFMASREEKEIKSVDVDDQVEYPDKEKDNGQLVLQRLQINYADGTYDFRYAFT